MIVKMTKLSDNKNAWVDGAGLKEGVIGFIQHAPRISESINLFTSDAKIGDSGYMYTTPVKEIEYKVNEYLVKTANSTYRLEVLPDDHFTQKLDPQAKACK